jgi:hypothetical protein
MIDTILNRRKTNQNSSIASLSIQLFPEFGWPVGDNNERVYGPGTLFQGKHTLFITKITVGLSNFVFS